MSKNIEHQYLKLLKDILDNGVTKQDRTGTGTLSVFGRQIRHKMSDGFPLLTTKKMPFRLIATELMWFLRGDTNIKFLVDNDCHIWDGDAYKNYINNPDYKAENYSDLISSQAGQLVKCPTQEDFINKIKTDDEFAKEWGELGPIYGKQWRKWETYDNEKPPYLDVDQIQNLINDLKTNPDSRRLMVNAWNVGELHQMVLPPCHYGFQVYTRELSLRERMNLCREKLDDTDDGEILLPSDIEYRMNNYWNIPTRAISLMWNQRSVDTFLGLPFNIASYGLLLEIIAKEVNMVPDELIGSLGDTHLYLNHIEQAKEQIGRELSLEERKEIYEKEYTDGMKVQNDEWLESKLKTRDIPTRTREPYPLPTLKHMKTDEFYKALSEDASLFAHLDSTDFQVENYQAHPHIKAPLSN
jgi:thymidylate synthase